MPKKIIEEKAIPVPITKKKLQDIGRDLNQFQKRTLDYATVFAKTSPKDSEELVERLMKFLGLSHKESVQVVNCMPESIEELRAFVPRHRLVEPAKLQEALKLISDYRK